MANPFEAGVTHAPNEVRTNINAAVSRVGAGSPFDIPDTQPLNLWEANKPERNGIGARILLSAFRQTYAARQSGERGKYGLLDVEIDRFGSVTSEPTVIDSFPNFGDRSNTEYETPAPFDNIDRAVFGTIRFDIKREVDRRSALPPDSQDFRELARLNDLSAGLDDPQGDSLVWHDREYFFLSRGAATATRIISDATRTIDQDFWNARGEYLTGAQLADALRKGHTTFGSLAGGHISKNIMTILNNTEMGRSSRFNDGLIYLDSAKAEPRIALDKDSWRQATERQWEQATLYLPNGQEAQTTGCPALASSRLVFNTDEDKDFISKAPNVIQGVINWYADILQTL